MKDRDPHGCAPEKSETVLLLVDVINDFDFPGNEKLLRFALPAARRIAKTQIAASQTQNPDDLRER